MNDGSSILWTIAMLFGIGFAIVRWMPRVRPHEERIRNWAIGLAIVSGFVFFFADPLPNRRSSDDLGTMIGASALAGAGAGFVWYFSIASLTFAYQYVIAPPFRLLGSWRLRLSERRARRAEERRRLREQREWERSAPQRERAQRDADARKQAEASHKADAQRRRSDVRANCELLYSHYAPEIGQRFPRSDLDAWITKHMSDNDDPAVVEQRAEQLRRLIEYHREQVKPIPKFSNIRELADWFHTQKTEIESLPVDDRVRRALLSNLNERNAN
jgi:hypothetical protein